MTHPLLTGAGDSTLLGLANFLRGAAERPDLAVGGIARCIHELNEALPEPEEAAGDDYLTSARPAWDALDAVDRYWNKAGDAAGAWALDAMRRAFKGLGVPTDPLPELSALADAVTAFVHARRRLRAGLAPEEG